MLLKDFPISSVDSNVLSRSVSNRLPLSLHLTTGLLVICGRCQTFEFKVFTFGFEKSAYELLDVMD